MTYKANSRVVVNAGREAFLANATVTSVNALATAGYTFQGSNYGYSPFSGFVYRHPFATDSSGSGVPTQLLGLRTRTSSSTSSTHAYNAGGGPGGTENIIDRFPFAVNVNATDVGDLTQARFNAAGQSSSTHGYASGGEGPSVPGNTNVIDKFPFASNTNATDVGNLTIVRQDNTGHSSDVDGYLSAGFTTPFSAVGINVIEKFPFAIDSNASDVGDLTQARSGASSQSSYTHGYTTGGQDTGTPLNTIDKFSFATNANATNVGDISSVKTNGCGTSSTSHGYEAGGPAPNSPSSLNISKFPFATDSNSSTVGGLGISGSFNLQGQQN
jgi:hypothetical protein